jgi:hypothetical protein
MDRPFSCELEHRSVVCLVSLAVALVLKQVFFPFSKGNQCYLVIFLGRTPPMLIVDKLTAVKTDPVPRHPGAAQALR